MSVDYDALYRATPAALGPPAAAVTRFLAGLPVPARLLDIGCGQGRDALPAARLGHRVTGIDLAPHGIAQMTRAAAAEGLSVDGQVADLLAYTPAGRFDAILCNRVLHMLPPAPRHALLARLLPCVAPGGAVLVLDEPRNLDGIAAVFAAADRGADAPGARLWAFDRARRGGQLLARRR